MRMVGPNCLGVIDNITHLNASFAALMPLDGSIAFMSQSGAICTAILDWSVAEGIGFSRFVSLGNKADVDEVTLLQAWNDDPQTRVILAYLEGIASGQRFVETSDPRPRLDEIHTYGWGVGWRLKLASNETPKPKDVSPPGILASAITQDSRRMECW